GADQSPFCSGWDVRDLAGLDTSARKDVARYFEAGRELLRAIEACPVPVVTAVSGVALGFGCSILAHSDLVIADVEAQFGLPEIKRGFPPATVVPELLEAMDAREIRAWALTGGRYDVHRASSAGLVHRIAPAGQLAAVLTEVLAEFAGSDPAVLRQAKALLREQQSLPLPQRRARGVAAAVDHFCK
ncbi:MAG: enoyl-CoA hydratase/isomerase family protein, partial [Microthrixaceae bacterium]